MKAVVKFFVAIAIVAVFQLPAFAQEPLDGAYIKTVTKEKEVIPYDFLREADVFWSKRVWRVIDVREKMNLAFKYPQAPLIDIIHTAAKNGDITVYDPAVENADQFKEILSVDDVKNIGESTDTVTQIDAITFDEITVIQKNEFNFEDVVKYRVKEDWVFDEQTSTMLVRIIGIAPVMDYKDASGNSLGDKVMYWCYYPDLRPLPARHEVFNPKNDAVTLSWEDLFEARKFQSYIIKESNVYDRPIQEYATGIDALLESERIKNEIFTFEHDLWNY